MDGVPDRFRLFVKDSVDENAVFPVAQEQEAVIVLQKLDGAGLIMYMSHDESRSHTSMCCRETRLEVGMGKFAEPSRPTEIRDDRISKVPIPSQVSCAIGTFPAFPVPFPFFILSTWLESTISLFDHSFFRSMRHFAHSPISPKQQKIQFEKQAFWFKIAKKAKSARSLLFLARFCFAPSSW